MTTRSLSFSFSLSLSLSLSLYSIYENLGTLYSIISIETAVILKNDYCPNQIPKKSDFDKTIMVDVESYVFKFLSDSNRM
jgi:hypothetical protein